MISSNLTAAILAGGKSSRFGSSKYLARFGDKSLIEISLEIARQISNNIIVLKGDERIDLSGNIASYSDIFPEKGPIGGIYTALSYAETDWVAVIPVDMPFISPQIYFRLFEAKSDSTPAVAVSTKGLEPLVSLWPVSTAPELKMFIESDILSLWKVLNKVKAVKITVSRDDSELSDENFFNINTQEDLELLQKINTNLKIL